LARSALALVLELVLEECCGSAREDKIEFENENDLVAVTGTFMLNAE
jgi:hypothetical protein